MLFLAAEENAAEELKSGVDICLFETEVVRHSIEFFDSKSPSEAILLQMETEGSIQSMLSGDQPRTAIQSIDHLIELGLTSNTHISEIASIFEKASIKDFESPQCHLCDTDFIGIFRTKLTHINDHKLANEAELAIQRGWFDIDDDFHKFFKADYGDCFNIKNIQSYSAFAGIKRVDSSKNIAHNLRCGDHITIDHIEESYRRGSLLKYSVPELVLCSNFDIEDHETAPPETVIAIKPENNEAIRKAINDYLN